MCVHLKQKCTIIENEQNENKYEKSVRMCIYLSWETFVPWNKQKKETHTLTHLFNIVRVESYIKLNLSINTYFNYNICFCLAIAVLKFIIYQCFMLLLHTHARAFQRLYTQCIIKITNIQFDAWRTLDTSNRCHFHVMSYESVDSFYVNFKNIFNLSSLQYNQRLSCCCC